MSLRSSAAEAGRLLTGRASPSAPRRALWSTSGGVFFRKELATRVFLSEGAPQRTTNTVAQPTDVYCPPAWGPVV